MNALPPLPKAPRAGRWWRVSDFDLNLLCEERAPARVRWCAQQERDERAARKRRGRGEWTRRESRAAAVSAGASWPPCQCLQCRFFRWVKGLFQ